MSKESAYFKIMNLKDDHDLKKIKKELDAISGVISVSVNKGNHRVAVDFDTTGVSHSQIENKLNTMNFQIDKEIVENNIM